MKFSHHSGIENQCLSLIEIIEFFFFKSAAPGAEQGTAKSIKSCCSQSQGPSRCREAGVALPINPPCKVPIVSAERQRSIPQTTEKGQLLHSLPQPGLWLLGCTPAHRKWHPCRLKCTAGGKYPKAAAQLQQTHLRKRKSF